MTARIPTRNQMQIASEPRPSASVPFVGALRICCRHNGLEYNIIDHAIAWCNGHTSHACAKAGDSVFLLSDDLGTAEVRDLQVMAVAHGPSVEQLRELGAPMVSKDIHVTTGRIPLRSVLEMATRGSTEHPGTAIGFISIGYDPVQPGLELLIQAAPLPSELASRHRQLNERALAHLNNVEPSLVPMSQERITQYNMRQNMIARSFYQGLMDKGLKLNKEGIMSGVFVSSIANTMLDVLTNMEVVMAEKAKAARTTALDAFGLTAALLKVTGLSHFDHVDAAAAGDCLANLGGLLASDLTYSSDIKPNLQPPKRRQQAVVNKQGDDTYVMQFKSSADGSPVPYKMGEDIMIPLSDVYLREAHADGAMHEHLLNECQDSIAGQDSIARQNTRVYTPGYRLGDCEDGTNIAILQFSFIRRLCVRLSSRCDVIYQEHPDMQPMKPEAFAEAVYRSLRGEAAVKEWTDLELRNVIRQCGELGEHLWDTRMRPVLMSARAAKMESGPDDKHSPDKDPNMLKSKAPLMGHCAAMIVRGTTSYASVANSQLAAAGLDNKQSNYDRILTELTAPIRIESFAHRTPPSNKLSAFVTRKLRGSGIKPAQTEAGFYNQCTVMMAPGSECKAWVHVGKLGGVFWHVVSSIGDTLVMKDGVLGVPIDEACATGDTGVQGIKVRFTAEEIQETRIIARYALPPVDCLAGMFSGSVSRPLQHSLYGGHNIPISYIVSDPAAPVVQSWIQQSPNSRYLVNIGARAIAVHQMGSCSIDRLRQSAAQTDRYTIVKDL